MSGSMQEQDGEQNTDAASDICKHWLKGSCRFSGTCRFIHEASGVVIPPPASTASGGTTSADQPAMPKSKGGWPRQETRVWVHLFLYKNHPDFDLIPMLIGKGGQNMRNIYAATGAKIRIRGRGSGHFEVEGKKEAPVHLMMAITALKSQTNEFRQAVDMAVELLVHIIKCFKEFCAVRNLPPELAELPLFSIGEIAKGSCEQLRDLLTQWPHPGGPRLAKTVTPGGVSADAAIRLNSELPVICKGCTVPPPVRSLQLNPLPEEQSSSWDHVPILMQWNDHATTWNSWNGVPSGWGSEWKSDHSYGEAAWGGCYEWKGNYLDYGYYGEDGWADDYDCGEEGFYDQNKAGSPDADAEKWVDADAEKLVGADAEKEWDDISSGITSAVAKFLENCTFEDEV